MGLAGTVGGSVSEEREGFVDALISLNDNRAKVLVGRKYYMS